jgi:hypothetical protein
VKAYWNQTQQETDDCEGVRVNYTTWGVGHQGVFPGQFHPADFYDATYGATTSIPYWQDDRHPMPYSGWIQVNWHTLGKAFAIWPRGKQQWLSKHMARFSATGRVMSRRK